MVCTESQGLWSLTIARRTQRFQQNGSPGSEATCGSAFRRQHSQASHGALTFPSLTASVRLVSVLHQELLEFNKPRCD
jgi:hypothetical protein